MSVPVSIGDILLIVNGTLTLFSRLKNASAELTLAQWGVEQVRTALEVLGIELSDKTSFLAQQSKM